jgi:magnesium-transporting ATPase (P-type)
MATKFLPMPSSLRQNDFSVNESILTGESLPVLKETEGSNNNVYQGTHDYERIVRGAGDCRRQTNRVGQNRSIPRGDRGKSHPLARSKLKVSLKAMVAVGS